MRFVIDVIVVCGIFFIGAHWQSKLIQATCESDDQKTFINGTEYMCLSQRHVEMLKQQSRGETTSKAKTET